MQDSRTLETGGVTGGCRPESGAEEEGGRSSKRPDTVGEGLASKDTPDPVAKRTRARTSNPEGLAASLAGAEKSSQQPPAECHEEGEEYDLRRTRGGSAASPLGVQISFSFFVFVFF